VRHEDLRVGQRVKWTSGYLEGERCGIVVWVWHPGMLHVGLVIEVALAMGGPGRKFFRGAVPCNGVVVRVDRVHAGTGRPLKPHFYGPGVTRLDLVKMKS